MRAQTSYFHGNKDGAYKNSVPSVDFKQSDTITNVAGVIISNLVHYVGLRV